MIANPTSQSATAGTNVSFTATASGNPAPTVQWQVSIDGGNTFGFIPGAFSNTLTIDNVQKYQSGYEYQAVFANSVGGVTSNPATLIVPSAPAVTISPNTQSVVAGKPATFNAAASGSPTPTVQWQISTDGGATWTDISGAASNTLSFPSVQPSQDGTEYRTVFTNVLGTTATSAATLNVLSAPSVSSNPGSQTVVAGQKVSFTAADDANPTPTVQWQVSTDGGITFTNIKGAINPTLTLVGTTTAMNGFQYQAVFSNSQGSATTNPATLTVLTAVAPFITLNPVSQTVAAGANAVSFAAFAVGTPTPSVQWQVSTDGGHTFSNIPGATSTTLTLNSATTAINGYEFQAVFSNAAGNAISIPAKLTVTSSASSSQTPVVNVPPLLALIDGLIGAVEKMNADGTLTFTYTLFGFPLIVATYDSSGNFVSASLLGISLPKSVWFM